MQPTATGIRPGFQVQSGIPIATDGRCYHVLLSKRKEPSHERITRSYVSLLVQWHGSRLYSVITQNIVCENCVEVIF